MITIHFDVIIFLIWPARKIMLEMVVYDSPHPHAIIVMPGLHAPLPVPQTGKWILDTAHCSFVGNEFYAGNIINEI